MQILTCTKQLSDKLQSTSIDLSRASELILATKSLLLQYRSDEYWGKVYDYATRVAGLHNIAVEVTTQPRRRKRPAHLRDSVVYECTGSRGSPSVRDEFKTQLYFPVLDQFLQELNHRFQDQNNSILRGISACTPTASNFLCLNDLQAFSEKYGVAGTSLEVEVNLVKQLGLTTTLDSLVAFRKYLHSCQPAYNTLYQLAHISLTIAVTSAESERSFSTLKRIKTRLRSRMVEDRLSALTILSIERER